jgi:hypothetical protein
LLAPAGAAVVVVTTGLAVVGVTTTAPDLTVVVVVGPAAAAVVVVEDAVVEVVLLCFFSVVVVLDACFSGVLDPHAAAIRPPATTKVTTIHRFFPLRPDAVSATSGVTRVNTAAPLVMAVP